MTRQVCVVAVVCGALGSVPLGPTPLAARSQPSIAEAATGAWTPWGDPDLQGVWDYWTFTPFERPDVFAGRDVLTDEEAVQVAAQGRSAALARDREGPGEGSTGAYGYPIDQAAHVALATICDFTQSEGGPALVRFVLFESSVWQRFVLTLEEITSPQRRRSSDSVPDE